MADTSRTIRVRFDGTATGLAAAVRQAERDLAAFQRAQAAQIREQERAQAEAEQRHQRFLGSLSSGSDRVLSTFGAITTGVLKLGAAGGSLQTLTAAVGSLASMSGILAAVPAVAGAGAASLFTFKLATQGVGDAFKAGITGDTEKFAEAITKLAPGARQSAESVARMAPAFKAMQQGAQDAFFTGWSEQLDKIGTKTLPGLETGVGRVAAGMGEAGRRLLEFAAGEVALTDMNTVLDGTGDLWDGLADAPADVLEGILALSAEGSGELGGLGDAIGGAAGRFKEWAIQAAEAGRVQTWIKNAKEEFRTYGGILKNVGSIGVTVFDGLSLGGYNFSNSLLLTTAKLDEFLKSAEGQQILKELGETLGVTADVAREVFLTALQELGPVIKEAAPAAREVAVAVGDFLVSALRTAGPILQDVAGFLSEHKDVLGDLVPIVLSAVAAYKGFKVVSEVKGWADDAIAALTGMAGRSETAGRNAGGAFGRGFKGGLGALGLAGAGIGATILLDELIPKDAGRSYGAGFARDMLGEMATVFRGEGDLLDQATVARWISNPVLLATDVAKRALTDLFGLKPPAMELTVNAETGPARTDVVNLMDTVNKQAGTVEIDGRTEPAGQALADILQAIRLGQESVTINGNRVPVDEALALVMDQINKSVGEVSINGTTVPAGDALALLIQTVNSSTGDVTIGGKDFPAKDALNALLVAIGEGRSDVTIGGQDFPAKDVLNILLGTINRSGGSTTIDARDNVTPRLQAIWAEWNGRTINVNIGGGGVTRAAGGPIEGFAGGGAIRGPGTGTSDSILAVAGRSRAPIWLSNGEHVLTAAEVRMLGGHTGVYRLRAAIRAGTIPRFATGGAIPAWLGAGDRISQARTSFATTVRAGDTDVRVFLDGEQLRGMVRSEIASYARQTRRTVRAGAGGGF